MKKLISYLSLLFLIFSCDKEKLNDVEKDLYDKVAGRWEVISCRQTGYFAFDPDDPNDLINHDNLLHDDYFHISDVKDFSNEDFFKAMLFEEDGDINIESNLVGVWYYSSWEVKNEQLHIELPVMDGTELFIHSFDETTFHFTLEHLLDHKYVDDDGIDHRELTLRIEEWELKRY